MHESMSLIKNKRFVRINVILIGILFLLKTTLAIYLIGENKDEFDLEIFNILNNNWLWVGISAYVILVPAYGYLKIYKGLFKGKFHMDFLISAAMHLSFLFSLIVTIIDNSLKIIVEPIGLLYAFDTISKAVEDNISRKNDKDRTSLESLKVTQVMMEDGTWRNVWDVEIGEVIMFHNNEIIQFDGTLSAGEGSIDTSNINGESKPYYIKTGSAITSGTKVISKMILMKVTKLYKDSTLNQLIKTIQKTNKSAPKMQNLANKIYKIFIPTVFLLSLLSFILWLSIGYVFDMHPYSSKSSSSIYSAFFITISVLAISCPCAMTMVAPLVSYVTAQYYWRNNIIFNKVKDMETINKVTHVILDKTGTLTTGEMEIERIFGDTKYHAIAAALEETVFHPIATAIYKEFNESLKATDIKNISGRGVSGKVNGVKYTITKTTSIEINKTFKKVAGKGTFVGVYKGNVLLSAYVLKSVIKVNAPSMIKFFKSKNIVPIMLSGDNEEATKYVANKLKIDYRSEQSPTDKAKYVQSIQKQGGVVMMIGDGLNDSIAIKYSDVSISFSHGSTITNSYSSISLLDDNLKSVIFLFKMAKKAKLNYLIALFWAMIFNITLIPLAMAGLIQPWVSAGVMYLSNIILYTVIFTYWFKLKSLEKDVYGYNSKKVVKPSEDYKYTSSMHAHHNH